MKRTLLIFTCAALAAVIPARASVYSVDFTGTVSQTQGATGQSVGNQVSGHFDLNSLTGNFFDFSIASRSIASGFASSANIVPAFTDAIYTAQLSPLVTGGTTNSTFSLDLSSLTTWPASETAFSLLTDTAQLKSNLDTVSNALSAFPSTFNYYTANANGTNVVALTANLTSIAAVPTPEPATLTLLVPSLFGLGFLVRRRRA